MKKMTMESMVQVKGGLNPVTTYLKVTKFGYKMLMKMFSRDMWDLVRYSVYGLDSGSTVA